MSHTIKMNSKWIIGLNVKCSSYKTPRRKHRRKRLWPWIRQWFFLNTPPKAKSIKEKKQDKLDLIKVRNFCSFQDAVNRMKTQVTNREKVFADPIAEKGKKYPETTKTTWTSIIGKQTQQFLNNGHKLLTLHQRRWKSEFCSMEVKK